MPENEVAVLYHSWGPILICSWIVGLIFLTLEFSSILVKERVWFGLPMERIMIELGFLGQVPGWDETNFLGRDRDREKKLIKIHYETETEKMWMLIFLTRRDRDETVWFFYVRDETETRLNSKSWARPRWDRESRCLFLLRREPTFNGEIYCIFG